MSKKKNKNEKAIKEDEKKEDTIEEKSEEESTEEDIEEEIKEGDFILLDITGKIEKTNDIFITTIKETAEKAGILEGNEQLLYEPQMVIVGDNFSVHGVSITGLSSKLVGMKVGETKAITIPPKDAFGERLAKNVKDYTMKKIKSIEKNPRPGKRIVIDNRSGIITRVDTRGRVKVDFNHPYAGLNIIYEVTIKKKISDKDEKLKSLITSRIPLNDPDAIKTEQENDVLSIIIQGNVAFQLMRQLPMIKFGLALDIQRYLNFETVKFVEIYGKDLFGGIAVPTRATKKEEVENEQKESGQ
ncbi:MAG: FKBP-type peptidyl-prolyl cis-trans isomerase [Candidatus Helarchaeota archaeon]